MNVTERFSKTVIAAMQRFIVEADGNEVFFTGHINGSGIVESVETLKEIVKVKFKDDEDGYFYKSYPASELKIIKSAYIEDINEEEEANLEELQKLENLEIQDSANKSDEEDF